MRVSRAVLTVVLASWIAGFLVGTARPGTAADLSQFDPGNIISDAVFFNPYTMTEAEIQAFLNQKGAACSGSLCLKNYTDTLAPKAGDQYCVGYPASGPETAARLIYRVSNSCGINPQVILVMLQKEQSLVTRTNATTSVYQKAMGFGCPDTAACDTAYYGFANQIYSAARQFQAYANSGRYTWYKVGQVNDVRYHPNAACGTGQVFIKNKATAGLYYYTPYQPNQAALNAGFGTGDSCSSYGNRNFFHYFSDWFGSAQSTTSLVQVPGQPQVWLVSGTERRHVVDYADLEVLASRLGWVRPVSNSYLQSLSWTGIATRYVHDPRNGTLYLLQADGTRHRFLTADQIRTFGYIFTSYTNLSGSQIDAFTNGPEVGDFFRIEAAPETYLLEAGAKRHVLTGSAFVESSSGRSSFVASMASSAAAALATGPSVLPRRTLVRDANGDTVFVTLGNAGLLRVPSFGLGRELGAATYTVLPADSLRNNPPMSGTLTPFVRCGATDYLAVGGTLRPVTGSSRAGFTPTALLEDACATLTLGTATVSAPFLIQVPGRPEVYVLEEQQLHHVRSYDRLLQLTGGAAPRLISWSADTAAGVGVGAPELAAGTYVQFAGLPEVYRGDGRQIRHVTTYDALLRANGGRVPTIEQLPAAQKGYYTIGAPIS